MANKKTASLNLLDEALGINGAEPIDITIGDFELKLRRSHTGMQIAEWALLEEERVNEAAAILENDKVSNEDKNGLLVDMMRDYAAKLLRALTVKPDETAIDGAAKLLAGLPINARNRVFRTIGTNAGVIDAEGNALPFTRSSETKSDIES